MHKEERIKQLIKMMRELEYDKKQTADYALAWGVSESTVQGYAAEASRAIRRGIDDETGGAYVLCRLEKRIDVCMENGDDKNLVKLLALHARLTGAEAAIRYEHKGKVEHEHKAFNPRAARKEFYEKNNRIGDMTDELNVEIVKEKALPDKLGTEVVVEYKEPEDDEPF